jgi:hypothetical protein
VVRLTDKSRHLQVYAAAGDGNALTAFVERYARCAVRAVQGAQRSGQRSGQQPLTQAGDLGREVQQVVAAAIDAAVEMGAAGMARHLLRLLPLLGCNLVEEPRVGAAVQAAVEADVSVFSLLWFLPCS